MCNKVQKGFSCLSALVKFKGKTPKIEAQKSYSSEFRILIGKIIIFTVSVLTKNTVQNACLAKLSSVFGLRDKVRNMNTIRVRTERLK